jgi:undecaprenyl-diphosphatase
VSIEQDLPVSAATLLRTFGGTVASGIVVVLVSLWLAWRRRGPGLAVWLGAVGLAQALNVVIKNAYERSRPAVGLVEEGSFSFVSGHSLTAAVLAITLVLVFVPAGPRRHVWLVVAIGYALVMAASRVYLRAHWLSDTLAGVTIGAACAVSVALLASWWYERR